jgi:hypothetical protein
LHICENVLKYEGNLFHKDGFQMIGVRRIC